MGDWAQSLLGLQQFLAERQQADQQDQARQQLADAVVGSGLAPQSDFGQQASGLMQLQQQMGNVGGQASGNIVTRHGVEGDAAALRVLSQAARQYPGLWQHVVSDYRTRAQQQALYNAYRNGTGNLAARPGHSMHEQGLAFDIDAGWIAQQQGLRALLDRLGGFPVGGEPWHWEPQFAIR